MVSVGAIACCVVRNERQNFIREVQRNGRCNIFNIDLKLPCFANCPQGHISPNHNTVQGAIVNNAVIVGIPSHKGSDLICVFRLKYRIIKIAPPVVHRVIHALCNLCTVAVQLLCHAVYRSLELRSLCGQIGQIPIDLTLRTEVTLSLKMIHSFGFIDIPKTIVAICRAFPAEELCICTGLIQCFLETVNGIAVQNDLFPIQQYVFPVKGELLQALCIERCHLYIVPLSRVIRLYVNPDIRLFIDTPIYQTIRCCIWKYKIVVFILANVRYAVAVHIPSFQIAYTFNKIGVVRCRDRRIKLHGRRCGIFLAIFSVDKCDIAIVIACSIGLRKCALRIIVGFLSGFFCLKIIEIFFDLILHLLFCSLIYFQ